MTRTIPPDRLSQLVRCATKVFIEQGYQRTQMADIAAALGVAKGTLYLYVESKDTLFDLVLRCADAEHPFAQLPSLPIPAPKPGATLQYVRERLTQNQTLPALAEALSRQRVADPRAELEAIVRELYDTLARNRHGIKLLDRSAREHPELAALWFERTRSGLLAALSQYLETRIRHKVFPPVPDVAVTARLIIETVVFWAVHRHCDPHPQAVDDAVARETVIHFILNALVNE
jgi:AcrR family transcriptional regulator